MGQNCESQGKTVRVGRPDFCQGVSWLFFFFFGFRASVIVFPHRLVAREKLLHTLIQVDDDETMITLAHLSPLV